MRIDKNQAIIDYLIQCPQILNSPLYFNFINIKDNTSQILTTAEDITLSRPYIDGSINRRFTFNIITFKSITDSAIVKLENYANENVVDLSTVQSIIDWIADQEELRNYPDFGSDCIINSISTTTDTPRLEGINEDVSPQLAMYSISIVVDYLDTSKVIWGK